MRNGLIGLFVSVEVMCVAETAPNFLWVKPAGASLSQQQALSIGYDSGENSYVVGGYLKEMSFGNTNLVGNNNNEIFVAKFDPTGTCIWARRAGGNESDVAFGITVALDGTFYVTGNFRGTATFGALTVGNPFDGQRAFIAKYDSSGNCLWVRAIVSASGGAAVAADADGNVYLTGTSDGSGAFLAKYNEGGTALWIARSTGGASIYGQGLAVDESGNPCVVGRFSDTTYFDAVPLSSSGPSDIFLAKYDSLGRVLWAVSAGGAEFDESHGVTVTSGGDIVVTGYYRETASFGTTTLSGGGGFVASYKTNGAVAWVSPIGNGSDDAGFGLASDKRNNIYVAGGFSRWTFGRTNLQTSGGFIEKLAPGGVSQWRQRAGNNSAQAIAISDGGIVTVVGGFFGSSSFGQSVVSSSGDLDAFVGRLSPDILLKVSRSRDQVVLTWPAFPPCFRLQESDEQLKVWNYVPTNQISSSSEGYGIVLPSTNLGSAFFRLTRE